MRATVLAAIVAIATLVLGFAPFPHLWYVLGGAVIVATLVLSTGPRITPSRLRQPLTGLAGIAMLTVIAIRGTGLVWMGVPVLAGLAAITSWLVITQTYATLATPVAQDTRPTHTSDELAPRRNEKTAATDDNPSATAA